MKSRFINLLSVIFLTGIILLPAALYAQDFNTEMYKMRRQAFMDKMDGGIAVFLAAEMHGESYRQDSDFYYLTGYKGQNAAFILQPGQRNEFIFFSRKISAIMAAYNGDLPTFEQLKSKYGADDVQPLDKLESMVSRAAYFSKKLYYSFQDDKINKSIIGLIKRRAEAFPEGIFNTGKIVHELRLIKDEQEIALLQKACDITRDAQIEAMKAAEPGMNEYQIQAIIEYIYRDNGSKRPGFSSIVGSGPNSCILHYGENDRIMAEGDLIVMDIGADYGHYTADITRTIPVNGKYSKEQKELYNVVLSANKSAIEATKPGIGLSEVYRISTQTLNEGLYKLGLITDPNSLWQGRIWTIHGQGHWLGLDVHDVGDYQFNTPDGRILEPGMVFTIEPGIYISPSSLDRIINSPRVRAPKEEIEEFVKKVTPAAKKYMNMGIRIEDDVLVTKDGYRVLTKATPKEIREIEKVMKKDSYVNK